MIPTPLLRATFIKKIPFIGSLITDKVTESILKGVIGGSRWGGLEPIHTPLIEMTLPILLAVLRKHPPKEFDKPLVVLAEMVNPQIKQPSDHEIDGAICLLFRIFGDQLSRPSANSYRSAFSFLTRLFA